MADSNTIDTTNRRLAGDRAGMFWDFVRGDLPTPAAATTLGWSLRAVDPEAGTIEVGFVASEAFLNPVGMIQGGFLAAMLDDTLGPALVATLGPDQFAPTLNLDVQFHRPGKPGLLIGCGRITQRTQDVAFLAGELVDEQGRVVATATATALVRASSGLQASRPWLSNSPKSDSK